MKVWTCDWAGCVAEGTGSKRRLPKGWASIEVQDRTTKKIRVVAACVAHVDALMLAAARLFG